MSAVLLPEWFDKTKTARMPDTSEGKRIFEDARDAFLRCIVSVEQGMPLRLHETGVQGALFCLEIRLVKQFARDLGAVELSRKAEAMRRHVADKLGNKPSRDKAPRETLIAELLAECERTRVALLACGAKPRATAKT